MTTGDDRLHIDGLTDQTSVVRIQNIEDVGIRVEGIDSTLQLLQIGRTRDQSFSEVAAVALVVDVNMFDDCHHHQRAHQCACIRDEKLHDLRFSSAMCIHRESTQIRDAHHDVGGIGIRNGVAVQIRLLGDVGGELLELVLVEQTVQGIHGDRQIGLFADDVHQLGSFRGSQFFQFCGRDSFRVLKLTGDDSACPFVSLHHRDELVVRDGQCQPVTCPCNPQVHQILGPFQTLTDEPHVCFRPCHFDVSIHLFDPAIGRPPMRFPRNPFGHVTFAHDWKNQHGVVHKEPEQRQLERFLLSFVYPE